MCLCVCIGEVYITEALRCHSFTFYNLQFTFSCDIVILLCFYLFYIYHIYLEMMKHCFPEIMT